MKIIYKNATIITCDSDFSIIKNTTLVTDSEMISYIGDNYNIHADKVVDCSGLVLMPGFVNVGYNAKNINGITAAIADINHDFHNNDLHRDINLINIDNLSALHVENLIKNNNEKPIALFLLDYISQESEYGELLKILFNNNLKLVIKAGSTLEEMGSCDKYYKKTPIEYLESYGVLDKENIIMSCANLNKEDFSKLSEYNNSVCLTLSEDLLSGNGVPSLLTMQKYNLNMCLSNPANNMFREMFLAYALPRGILNTTSALSYAEVIKMATVNACKAMGLNKLGILKVGYYANFIALNINDSEDMLKNIVECGNLNKINFVIKNGKKINWQV